MAGSDKKTSWKQIGDYASLGVMMPAATVTGYFIGLALDRWLGTNFLYIVFLFVGIAAGFIELLRVVSKNQD